jgi:hypothetical protein
VQSARVIGSASSNKRDDFDAVSLLQLRAPPLGVRDEPLVDFDGAGKLRSADFHERLCDRAQRW